MSARFPDAAFIAPVLLRLERMEEAHRQQIEVLDRMSQDCHELRESCALQIQVIGELKQKISGKSR